MSPKKKKKKYMLIHEVRQFLSTNKEKWNKKND